MIDAAEVARLKALMEWEGTREYTLSLHDALPIRKSVV